MKPFIVCDHVDFGYENQDAVTDLSLGIIFALWGRTVPERVL